MTECLDKWVLKIHSAIAVFMVLPVVPVEPVCISVIHKLQTDYVFTYRSTDEVHQQEKCFTPKIIITISLAEQNLYDMHYKIQNQLT